MADAEKTLRRLLDETILQERGYKHAEISPISSGGANYTSALFLITATDPDKPDLKLFAKVAIVSEEMRTMMFNLFITEHFVYTELVNIYEELQQDVSDDYKFAFPKFYGCNANIFEETIVMEDLVAGGYSSYNRFESVDWEHASSAVEELAKFHALSFAFEAKNPEEFEKVIDKMQLKSPEIDDSMMAVWETMLARGLRVVDEDQQAKVVKLIEELGTEAFKKFNVPLGHPVLIHGDFRTSNLMFKSKGDKVATITLDFQTVHSGCPAADLIYFITTGTDEQFRREHFERLVEHYYEQLGAALKRMAVDVMDVYPREEFDSDFKELLPYSVILGLSVLPLVTVEAAQAPQVDGMTLTDFVVPANELFAQRFRGLINDCERWGVL